MQPGTRFCGQIEAAEHIDFQDFSGLPCWCRSGKWPWSIRFTATSQSRKTHESKTGLQKLMKLITHRNAVNLIRRMSFQCLVFTCFERRMSFWSFFLCLDVQLKWAYWTRWTLLLEKDLAPKSMLKTLFSACTAEALAKQEPAFWNSQCAVAQLSMQNQYLSMVCAYIAIKSVEIRWIDWNHTGPKHAALEAFLQVAWNQFTNHQSTSRALGRSSAVLDKSIATNWQPSVAVQCWNSKPTILVQKVSCCAGGKEKWPVSLVEPERIIECCLLKAKG